jgi:site-specific recombinase XerD
MRLYRRTLGDWLEWRARQGLAPAVADVRLNDFTAYFDYLRREHIPHATNPRRPAAQKGGVKPNTADSIYRVLRAFWTFLSREDDQEDQPLLTHAQTRYFLNDRVPRPAVPRLDSVEARRANADRNRAMTEEKLAQLLEAAGDGSDEESARNRAILLLLFESGLRVSELASLQDNSLDLAERTAWIVGKGRKAGVVFWGPRTAVALLHYLRLRQGVRGGDQPLFRGCSSRNQGGAVTDNLVRTVIRRLAARAGVSLPLGSPCHCFRRGFAQACRRAGLGREEVQALLRHDDLSTTLRYLGDDEAPLQRSHRRVFSASSGPEQDDRGEGPSDDALRQSHRRAFPELEPTQRRRRQR